MKTTVWLLVSLFAIWGASGQDKNDKWTPEDIIHTEYMGSTSFSPNGKMLVWTKQKAVKKKDRFVSDIYLTRLDLEKDGMPRTFQITNSDDSDYNPVFAPDNEWIYFLSGRDEGKKLWKTSIYGGEPQEVHEFENGISSIKWKDQNTLLFLADDGKTLYEQELEKEKDNTVVVEDSLHWKINRVFSFDLKEKKVTRLTRNNHPIYDYEVSRNGRWMIIAERMSPHYASDGKPDPKFFLYDLNDGSRTEILQGLQTPGNFQFTADNAGFYFAAVKASDPEWNGAGISEMYYYKIAEKTYQKINLDWDWSMEGDYTALGNDIIVNLANGALFNPTFYNRDNNWKKGNLDFGSKQNHVLVSAVSQAGDKFLYAYSTSSKLPRYYVAGLKMKKGAPLFENEKEVVKLNENLMKKPKAKSEVIKWKGYKGEEVDGILYYPENYEAGKKYPLILSIHGGPSASDFDWWRERWSTYPQILSQKGAFVLKPNYHGSSHHGLAFVESIKKNYYTPELEDITKGIDFLAEKGMVDKTQLGVMGWSNGAILTTMLTVKYPDMFKVACPGAGDVNWTSDFGTCRFGVTFDQSYFGGAPWDDVDGNFFNMAYIEKSPLFELEKVKTPTIIFHGSEDRAVPRDQGWEYYRALQQVGKAPVRFLWFPGQPHGLGKITHQLRKMKEEIAWIDQYLFNKEDSTNEAFKEDSPLAMLLKKEKAKRKDQVWGEEFNDILIPEVVAIAKDTISIGRFEVTNAQFKAFDPEFEFPDHQANHPARVGHVRAEKYIAWLAKTTSRKYRLPTAAEAEKLEKKASKLAKKENTLAYWAGYDIPFDDVPAFKTKLFSAHTDLFKEVGSFEPAKIGEAEVYDLGGNVAEYYGTEGKTYGYSAYDFADPNDTEFHPGEGHIGFRVILEK